MLAQETITAARQLLAQGLSQRQTAILLKISRGTIHAIAHGRIRDRVPRAPPPKPYTGRCPNCGRLVRMPCLACTLENPS
jgi:hypothetical protein